MAAPAMSSGTADTPQRRVRRDLFAEGLQRGGHHLGLEGARRNGVDGDGRGEPLGQMTRQLVHRRLRGGVGVRLERRHPYAVDRPDVDDACRLVHRSRLLQERHQELGQVEDALDVEGEHTLERRLVEVGQRRAPGGAGVVDQNVEGVLPRRQLVGQPPALGLGGQVGRNPDAGALLGELGRDLRHHVGLAGRDVDLDAGIDEALGDHLADAAGATGDQRRLPGNVEEVRGGHRPIVPAGVMVRPMPGRCAPAHWPRPAGTRPRRGRSGCGASRSNRPPHRRPRRSSSPAGGAGTR